MIHAPIADLLINPEYAPWVQEAFTLLDTPYHRDRLTVAQEQFAATDDFWATASRLRPYGVKNGVLTIPVHGMLLNDFPFALGGFATGYEYIQAAVERGAADPAVREIVLDVNSPGGVVTGCFDAADAIYALRGSKPIRASVNDSAYSAAYAIASAADEIVVARTGGVGSIGVIARHTDISARLGQNGMKVTFIYAGEHKIDGRPELPLTDQAKAEMQQRIDASYDIFVALVARNRGMTEEAVRATEAAVFLPRTAIEKGLADRQGSLGETVSANADPFMENEDEEMTTQTPAVATAATTEAAAPVAAPNTAAITAEATRAGATAERERISAILACDQAQNRPIAAMNVAMDTDMTVEKAAAFLGKLAEETAAAAPAAAPAAGTSPFEAAMASGNPELGAGVDTPAAAASTSRANGIFASAGFAPAKH